MTTGRSRERWQRIAELLSDALEREPTARASFLDEACAGDPVLRREVASLLAAHQQEGAVDRLGADVGSLAAQVLGTPASLVGRTVGHYRILERVGGGGMGIVYKALDTRLERTVALKFLQPRVGPDDSAAERFRLEARAIAALEHPNICTLHEIGETEDGQLFLTMPLYEGETLQRRIARGPVPLAEAVGIAVQIARGLAKAHARGIVHRDIKPSNVFLTDDGVVKILDFGIAKLADVTLTGGAGPLGTVAYMSPEQLRGRPSDHRSDLWSLGVVLYEMLTGRHPFLGDAAAAAPEAIQRADPVPVSVIRPDALPALERVVTTALAKSPDLRYQQAQAIESDLLALGLDLDTPGVVATPRPMAGRSPRGARWVTRAAVAVTVLGASAGALWLVPPRGERAGGDARAVPRTIAVLPFVDGSPGGDQEYFSDGITEELIATLARVEGLKVASRTSAFTFKGRSVDIRAVGEQLGVAAVLEGSVRRAADQLRITARLVNVADGYPLWSDSYDRHAGDAFAVQQEIARAIAQTLRVRLVGPATSGDSSKGPTATAFDLYLQGRYAWYTRTEQGLRTAAARFEQAVAASPGYARAHAGVADAYAVLGFYDFLSPADAFPTAEAAAKRALDLDPTLAAPHATLGYVQLYHHWNLPRGEEQFQRAIALEPNYSTAYQWYANLLTAAGRFPEAASAMRRAQVIDPLSLIANAALGWVLYHAGDFAAAAEQCRRTLELDPDYGLAHLWLGWALQEMDSLSAAVETHRRALAVTDTTALYLTSLARSLALAGEGAEAEALLRGLEARGERGAYVPAYEVAKVHEALGRTDRAFALLEQAYEQRSHSLVFLRVDPQLERLRADPRFARLVSRVFP